MKVKVVTMVSLAFTTTHFRKIHAESRTGRTNGEIAPTVMPAWIVGSQHWPPESLRVPLVQVAQNMPS